MPFQGTSMGTGTPTAGTMAPQDQPSAVSTMAHQAQSQPTGTNPALPMSMKVMVVPHALKSMLSFSSSPYSFPLSAVHSYSTSHLHSMGNKTHSTAPTIPSKEVQAVWAKTFYTQRPS